MHIITRCLYHLKFMSGTVDITFTCYRTILRIKHTYLFFDMTLLSPYAIEIYRISCFPCFLKGFKGK